MTLCLDKTVVELQAVKISRTNDKKKTKNVAKYLRSYAAREIKIKLK